VHREPAPPRWRWYADSVRRGLDGADHVVAPTAAMLEALVACHGRVRAASVIPNGVAPLPARYEPFGLSALEAALSGCALVLGDIDSLRENWSDAALFVAPDDRAALATALRRLIDDPDLRAGLADAARRRSREFSAAAMGDRTLELYRTLARDRRRQGGVTCAS
jgi:hypothetical protein